MNRQELAKHLGISISDIERNFPKIAVKQMSQGIEIIREGKGVNTEYTLKEVAPQIVTTSYFSRRPKNNIVIEDEQWVTCYQYPEYEVSNQGRVGHKTLQWIQKPDINKDGYARANIYKDGKGTRVFIHRLVLQSFNPQENWQELTVDHINGIRSDNRLINLRWATIEENIAALIQHRSDLNKELIRLINEYGYEETLKLLQNL